MRKTCWLLLLVIATAGCSKASTTGPSPKAAGRDFPADSYMAALVKKGKIVIGVKYDVPQFGALNPATGKPEGFDVDLGNIIAKKLGVNPDFVEAVSKNRIPFLNEDKVDLVISTMTINEERKKEIDFSNVYYIAQQRLLVKKNGPINEVADLDAKKGSVCSAKGSTSEKNLRQVAPNAEITLQDGYSQCFQLLQNGQVQAMSTDNVILTGFLKSDPANFKIAGKPFSSEPYGMGIKKGRVGFVEFVNGVLTDIKKNGTWVKLYNKWVKPVTGEPGQPPPDTAEAQAPSGPGSGAASPGTVSPSPASSPPSANPLNNPQAPAPAAPAPVVPANQSPY